MNVFHVKAGSGSLAQSAVDAVTNGVKTAYEQQFIPRLNGNYSGDSVTGVDLSTITGAVTQVALAGSPGSVTNIVPQNAACCITWKIPRHYRGGHPRTYLGPINDLAVETPTSFKATYVTQVTTAANTFLNAVRTITGTPSPCDLVAVHRYQNGIKLAIPETSVISLAVVDTRIDTMRRRLGRDR